MSTESVEQYAAKLSREKRAANNGRLNALRAPYQGMFDWAHKILEGRTGDDLGDPETVSAMLLISIENSNSARDILKCIAELKSIYGHDKRTINLKGDGLATSEDAIVRETDILKARLERAVKMVQKN